MSEPTRKRGRPREFDPAQALAGASETFLRHGYSATSLDALTQAMHVNKPSLYAAFGDKRALFLTVLKERYRRVGVRYRAAFEGGKTLEDALERVFEEAVEVCLGEGGPPGCPIASAVTEALEDEAIRAVTAQYRVAADKVFAEWVRSKAGPGGVALADGVARLATGVLYDIALRARVGEPRSKLRDIARDSAKILAAAASPPVKPSRRQPM